MHTNDDPLYTLIFVNQYTQTNMDTHAHIHTPILARTHTHAHTDTTCTLLHTFLFQEVVYAWSAFQYEIHNHFEPRSCSYNLQKYVSYLELRSTTNETQRTYIVMQRTLHTHTDFEPHTQT